MFSRVENFVPIEPLIQMFGGPDQTLVKQRSFASTIDNQFRVFQLVHDSIGSQILGRREIWLNTQGVTVHQPFRTGTRLEDVQVKFTYDYDSLGNIAALLWNSVDLIVDNTAYSITPAHIQKTDQLKCTIGEDSPRYIEANSSRGMKYQLGRGIDLWVYASQNDSSSWSLFVKEFGKDNSQVSISHNVALPLLNVYNSWVRGSENQTPPIKLDTAFGLKIR